MFSTMENPNLEFAFAIRLWFTRTSMVPDIPTGGWRSAVYVDGGEIDGPLMKGKAVPNSGGDYAHFRPDDTAVFDARYMLETDDGVIIQIRNKGLRHGPPDVMARLAAGDEVDPAEYYFRTVPEFIAPNGKYEWMNRSIFICSGARYPAGIKLWVWRVL